MTATAATTPLESSVSASRSEASSRASGAASLNPQATASPAQAGTPIATRPSLSTPVAPQPTATPVVPSLPQPASTAAPPGPVQAAAAVPGGSNVELVSDLLKAVNAYRAQNGRSALVFNASLTLAASNYARLLADRNYFSHDGPDGSTPESRIKAAGYRGSFRGETLGAGHASAQSTLSVWQSSPAHSRILLDVQAVEVGIGYYFSPNGYYGNYWVLVTGSP